MQKVLKQWETGTAEARQIYRTAWDVDGRYVLKVYEDRKALEKNILLSDILVAQGIPAAKVIRTREGKDYASLDGHFYLLTEKLPGKNLRECDETLACRMGETIGRLHLAFRECEGRLEVWDNSLLAELEGWVFEELDKNGWEAVERDAYEGTVERLRRDFDRLPRQIIHRDVHFGNFLFDRGEFCGYIDFDLTQRNIRIFDLCYFLSGLMSEEDGSNPGREEWLGITKAVFAGYEERIPLLPEEKRAAPFVMEGIELLCAAYFVKIRDLRCARDSIRVYQEIRSLEEEIVRMITEEK